MSGIEPGQGVAVFRLPMPMNGIELINDALHRIYGTGEWTLSFNGDQIQANAPAEGLGPIKGGRKTAGTKVSPDAKTVYLKVRDKVAQMTLEQSQETVMLLTQTTKKWFEETGGINYVEFGLQDPDGTPQPFVYCVQRRDGETPHALRMKAEAEVERLRALVKDMPDPDDFEHWTPSKRDAVDRYRAFLRGSSQL